MGTIPWNINKIKQLMNTTSFLKTLATAWLVAISLTAKGVALTADYFPDENFRSQIIYITGLAPGSEIPNDVLLGITSIDVHGKYISRLDGIGYFKNLTSLDCSSNNLEELDLTGLHSLAILDCSNNQLISLDIRSTDVLTNLECSSNQLSGSLDLEHERELINLNLYNNNLSEVKLYYHHALEAINVSNNTSLSALNLSRCPSLKRLGISKTMISQPDLSKVPLLEVLTCDDCNMTSLNLSKTPKLTTLSCGQNPLGTLDVSDMDALTYLDCRWCNLTKLVLPNEKGKLGLLYCNNNRLDRLDLSAYTNLKGLNCSNNNLTMLDLSANTNLTSANVDQNTYFNADWWKFSGDNNHSYIALHGTNACFGEYRIFNFKVSGISGTQYPDTGYGYLKVPWISSSSTNWYCPSTISYDFDTRNEAVGNMHVNVRLAQDKGTLQPVSTIHISDYDFPEDFEPGDYTATVDFEGAEVVAIEYIMYQKIIPNYEASAGERVGIRMKVLLPDGYYWSTPNAFIGSLSQNQRVATSDGKVMGFLWNYDVPVPAGGLYIRSVNETIVEPMAGAHPVFQTASMAQGNTSGVHYNVTHVDWLQLNPMAETEEEAMKYMTASDVFNANCMYYLLLVMEAKSGWQFSEHTACRLNNVVCGSGDNSMSFFTINLNDESDGLFPYTSPAIVALFTPSQSTAINNVVTRGDDTWYTLSGVRLNARPTLGGIYIHNGKKVVVK